MHSSYRSLGGVEGGAAGFFRAFLDLLGPGGTLVLPALSYRDVGPEQPVFDALRTAVVRRLSVRILSHAGAGRAAQPSSDALLLRGGSPRGGAGRRPRAGRDAGWAKFSVCEAAGSWRLDPDARLQRRPEHVDARRRGNRRAAVPARPARCGSRMCCAPPGAPRSRARRFRTASALAASSAPSAIPEFWTCCRPARFGAAACSTPSAC